MKRHRQVSSPTGADLQPTLVEAGLSNAFLADELRSRMSQEPGRLRALGESGPASALPHRETLRDTFSEVDEIAFHGGTPEARWACAGLGTSAFAHGDAIVCATATPSLEVLGHELSHLALRHPGGEPVGMASAGSSAEREAEAAGAAVAAGRPVELSAMPAANLVHGFPGFDEPMPWDLPIPDVGGWVEDLAVDLVDEVVEAVADEVEEAWDGAVDSVTDPVEGALDDVGDAWSALADAAEAEIVDALDLREDEDLLDFEEEGSAGAPELVSLLFDIVRERRMGMDPDPVLMALAREEVAALSNDDFRRVIAALDEAELLMEVTRCAFGGLPPEDEVGVFEVPVSTWRFWNADDHIEKDVERANFLYEPQGIHVEPVSERLVQRAEVERIVGHGVPSTFGLDRSKDGDEYTHADMVAVVDALGVGQIVSGLWIPTVVDDDGHGLSGTSMETEGMDHGANIAFVATDESGPDTFAHELGHILTRDGHFDGGDRNNLMTEGGSRDKDSIDDERLTDEQLEAIRADVLGYLRS